MLQDHCGVCFCSVATLVSDDPVPHDPFMLLKPLGCKFFQLHGSPRVRSNWSCDHELAVVNARSLGPVFPCSVCGLQLTHCTTNPSLHTVSRQRSRSCARVPQSGLQDLQVDWPRTNNRGDLWHSRPRSVDSTDMERKRGGAHSAQLQGLTWHELRFSCRVLSKLHLAIGRYSNGGTQFHRHSQPATEPHHKTSRLPLQIRLHSIQWHRQRSCPHQLGGSRAGRVHQLLLFGLRTRHKGEILERIPDEPFAPPV